MHQCDAYKYALICKRLRYKTRNKIQYNYGKILKNVKIHFNYLIVKLNDCNLPNNVHEILSSKSRLRANILISY